MRLAPFKFTVKHTRGVDNVVADALSRIFEGKTKETPEMCCSALWESLPLVYSSLQEHQKEDPFCKQIRHKVLVGVDGAPNFSCKGSDYVITQKGQKDVGGWSQS